jgi:hypothetical protein
LSKRVDQLNVNINKLARKPASARRSPATRKAGTSHTTAA